MGRYQALYGLKPMSNPPGLVRELLADVTMTCETCEGTGINGSYGGMGWRACPTCHGFGVVYTISLAELEARRRKVLEAYPDVGAANWRPCVPIHCPVLDLQTGKVIDACPPTEQEPVQGDLPLT